MASPIAVLGLAVKYGDDFSVVVTSWRYRVIVHYRVVHICQCQRVHAKAHMVGVVVAELVIVDVMNAVASSHAARWYLCSRALAINGHPHPRIGVGGERWRSFSIE